MSVPSPSRQSATDRAAERARLDETFDRLLPLLRSVCGPGIEQSLDIIGEHVPLSRTGVASGERVFDWEVPPAWDCRTARLTGPGGEVICDLRDNTLHVVSFSTPVDRRLTREQLDRHLHSDPGLPEAIPYVTSYYRRTWGFCLPDAVRARLPDGTYHALIDASFTPGAVPLAEAVLPGDSERELLLTSYLCHPALANNELSGPLCLMALYARIARWPRRRHRIRFLLAPETIGSLCFLREHGDELRARLDAGLVLTCVGGPEPALSFKCSRRGDGPADRLARHWHDRGALRIRPFTPVGGSDERQYCSPGFDLPVGQLARTVYGEYPEYHTSLDTKQLMSIDRVIESVDAIERFVLELDNLGPHVNLQPFGEPQLGARGLYPTRNAPDTRGLSSDDRSDERTRLGHMLTLLSCSDGHGDLVDVAAHRDCAVADLLAPLAALEAEGLIEAGPR